MAISHTMFVALPYQERSVEGSVTLENLCGRGFWMRAMSGTTSVTVKLIIVDVDSNEQELTSFTLNNNYTGVVLLHPDANNFTSLSIAGSLSTFTKLVFPMAPKYKITVSASGSYTAGVNMIMLP